MVPDPGWLAERRDRLVGLVITHAHEDHVGAVAHLWPQLRCPIYAGPFVSAVLRRKLGEAGLNGQAQVITVPLGGPLYAAALRPGVPPRRAFGAGGAGAGDPHPARAGAAHRRLEARPRAADRPADRRGRLRRASARRACSPWSATRTNALVEGHSGSEAEVRRNLAAIIRAAEGAGRRHLLRHQHRPRREHRPRGARRPGGRSRCSAARCATPRRRRANAATSRTSRPSCRRRRRASSPTTRC